MKVGRCQILFTSSSLDIIVFKFCSHDMYIYRPLASPLLTHNYKDKFEVT